MDKFEKDLTTLHPILTECRVLKSDKELALIQFANDISSEAHVEVTISKMSYSLNTFIQTVLTSFDYTHTSFDLSIILHT